LLWVLLIFYLGTSANTLMIYARGAVVLANGKQIPLRNSPADQVARLAVTVLKASAAIQLFRLRRSAIPLFACAWIGAVCLSFKDGWLGFPSRYPVLIVGVSMLWAIVHTIWFVYALHLQECGTLRSGA